MVTTQLPGDSSELRTAAAVFAQHVQDRSDRSKPEKPRWRRWLTPRRVAVMVVVDLTVGIVGYHELTGHVGGAAGVVKQLVTAAGHRDWQTVYDDLCSSDQRQFTQADVAEAGSYADARLGGIAGVKDLTVTSVSVPVGPLHLPGATVAGRLLPVVGQPSQFTLTALRNPIGEWKVCLSVGGYSSTSLQVNVALGSATATDPLN